MSGKPPRDGHRTHSPMRRYVYSRFTPQYGSHSAGSASAQSLQTRLLNSLKVRSRPCYLTPADLAQSTRTSKCAYKSLCFPPAHTQCRPASTPSAPPTSTSSSAPSSPRSLLNLIQRRITKVYETETYDYPTQVQESLAELGAGFSHTVTSFAATNLKVRPSAPPRRRRRSHTHRARTSPYPQSPRPRTSSTRPSRTPSPAPPARAPSRLAPRTASARASRSTPRPPTRCAQNERTRGRR